MSLVRRYARTLRHLKPWQVVGRVVAPLRRRWAVRRVPEPPSALAAQGAPKTDFPAHDPWNSREAVRRGCFCFLNDKADLGRPVDWPAPSRSLLWRFNLHYFQYLHLLAPDEQVALCREWVARNPVGEGVGWHPYPTALRIVNWCRAGLTAPDLLASLYRQAAYLYRNLETHVCGNHLLENARALVLAGRHLRGQGEANRWLERGLAIYRAETEEQILADGFHFERSPMYHALVLEGYLDVLNVLPVDHPAWEPLADTTRQMTDALVAVTHPDGGLALFNDTTHEIAPPPQKLRNYAARVLDYAPQPTASFPEAGYFIHSDADVWLMLDAGPGGPPHLMAHAHADCFSYELSVEGRRFVVDTGVYEYAAGPMRRHVRSTAAHNTVQVDGTDQMECWDSFRVAGRAAPHDVRWEPSDYGVHFEGTFSGYRRLIGDRIRHTRRLRVDHAARAVEVTDEVTGRGRHRIESRVHLHPAVHLEKAGSTLRLEREGVSCALHAEGMPIEETHGWYCPRFGVRREITVLVLGGAMDLPARLTYYIQY